MRYYSIFFTIFVLLSLSVFTKNGYCQDKESLKKSIEEADKEETRLLQEELRLKQQRNAEITKRIDELKQTEKPANPPQPEDSGSQTVSEPQVIVKPEKEITVTTDDTSKNPSGKQLPSGNDGGTKADTKSGNNPDAINKLDTLKCRDFNAKTFNQFSIFKTELCKLIENSKPDPRQKDTTIEISLADSEDILPRLILAKVILADDDSKLLADRDFLLKAEKVRTDKQIGADSKSKGTTSITSKGGIPALFGFAVENGAATSSVDGTTLTFRVNPAGLLQAATGSDYRELFNERSDKPFLDFLGKTSLGFSFDAARGNVETPTFTGSERQLSAFSFRYEFINERSPKSSRFKDQWLNFAKNGGQKLFDRQAVLFSRIYVQKKSEDNQVKLGDKKFTLPKLQEWLDNANKVLKDNSKDILSLENGDAESKKKATDKMEDIILAELEKLPASEIRASSTFDDLAESVEADAEYVAARNDVFDEIAKGQVATFEYINFREPIKPDMHSLRFIWEKGVYKGIDFTVNASLTFYNRKPTNPEVRRIRDFDFSGQFDIPLRRADLGFLKDSVISFAGKYQRLNTDVVNDLGLIVPGTKGDIGVGQVKWTIPIGDTGLKLPLSFTFANRTELIKEKETRGNFGLTIDFDSILARFRSLSPIFSR